MSEEARKSEIILDAVRQRSKEKLIDVEEEKVKLVIFSILGSYYAFNGSDIKEILPHTKIFFVPGTPNFILGVINVRGDIESVISINRFLGLHEEESTQQGRILIAEKTGMRSGIAVDSIEDVADFSPGDIKPPLVTLDKTIKELVAGETMYNGKNVTLVELGSIFERIRV